VKGFLVLITILFVSGCASMINGTKQTVTFTSTPSRAQVLIDGRSIGVTPLTASIKKNKYDSVMVKKEGYAAQAFPLDKSFDGVALLNIFWDLSTTDAITGAIYEYEPSQFHILLEKEEGETKVEEFENVIKNLVLGFGAEIRSELLLGENAEAISALVQAINSHSDKKADVLIIKAFAGSSKDNLRFANEIIDYYGSKN